MNKILLTVGLLIVSGYSIQAEPRTPYTEPRQPFEAPSDIVKEVPLKPSPPPQQQCTETTKDEVIWKIPYKTTKIRVAYKDSGGGNLFEREFDVQAYNIISVTVVGRSQ